jgi:hypothetical protein
MRDTTYSLGLVVDFLDKHDIKYKYCNANIGILFYNHGCRIDINNTYALSIQTHPDISGTAFAETALQNMVTKEIVDDGTYGYYDVQRWCTPEQLFDHIRELTETYDV